MFRIKSNIFDTAKSDCVWKARQIFSFLPLINNSITSGLSFLLLSISAINHQIQSMICVFYLDCNLQYFYNYHPYHSGIQ